MQAVRGVNLKYVSKKSCVGTVFGSNEIAQKADMKESTKMLYEFSSYGLSEIDTAIWYGDGATENYLGNLSKSINSNFTYATKANPWNGKGLAENSVKRQLETSLANLKQKQVDIFYLHAPDYGTPLCDTLKAVNNLYKKGKFKEFGLSNYPVCLVEEVVNLSIEKGWVLPTVYQGMYSALTRMVETELFPCLRYYGLRFYAFSPLGSGFLTGKYTKENLWKDKSARFSGSGEIAIRLRKRYWKPEYFDALDSIHKSLNSAYGECDISIAEASYRWLYHHSALNGDKGDSVIVGASSAVQLRQNLAHTRKGPLNGNVVNAYENVWSAIAHMCPNFAR